MSDYDRVLHDLCARVRRLHEEIDETEKEIYKVRAKKFLSQVQDTTKEMVEPWAELSPEQRIDAIDKLMDSLHQLRLSARFTD